MGDKRVVVVSSLLAAPSVFSSFPFSSSSASFCVGFCPAGILKKQPHCLSSGLGSSGKGLINPVVLSVWAIFGYSLQYSYNWLDWECFIFPNLDLLFSSYGFCKRFHWSTTSICWVMYEKGVHQIQILRQNKVFVQECNSRIFMTSKTPSKAMSYYTWIYSCTERPSYSVCTSYRCYWCLW